MKITQEQSDKILQKLKDYGLEVIDTQLGHKEHFDIFNVPIYNPIFKVPEKVII